MGESAGDNPDSLAVYPRQSLSACPAPTPNLFSQCPFSCSLRPLGWRPPLRPPLPPAPGFRPHHWSHTAASWLVLPPTRSTSAGVWAASVRARTLRAPRRGVHQGTPGGRKALGCTAVAWMVSAGGGSHVVFYPERFFLLF